MGKLQLEILFLTALTLGGCAASAGRSNECTKVGGCKDGGGGHDLAVGADLSVVAAPDLAIVIALDLTPGGKAFGAPCGDQSECASGLCILAGIGGVCSKLCDGDPCPDGYGCFGVLGAIDPGQVVDVCVTNRTQICTPCTVNSECATVSSDICYDFPSGGKYCTTDCSTIACPTGYTCTDIASGSTTLHQCVPNSGACDCNPTLAGAMKNCDITLPTPLTGTCGGVRTCQGETGWSACSPPSTTDDPDDAFVDSNCDGIDGDASQGIFVANKDTHAFDDSTCGTLIKPCLTIARGLQRANASGIPNVYIQAGDYPEEIKLASGSDKNLIGGYDSAWHRGSRATSGHVVTVTGALDSDEGQYMTLRAHGSGTSTINELVLVGVTPPDPANVGAAGPSTYVVHINNATVTLHNVTLTAGNGASGHKGSTGTNANATAASPAMNAGTGGNARSDVSVCDDSDYGGPGPAGSNASCSGDTYGGDGGTGGKEDSQCCCDTGFPLGVVCIGACCGSRCNATGGTGGGNGAQLSGNVGKGGLGVGTCAAGNVGHNGSIHNGSGGIKVASSISSAGYFAPGSGGSGNPGGNGGGGGGGSAAGGCDSGNVPFENSTGAGGGGGGAGGCKAQSGGGGGGGGGGSFGAFVYNGTLNVTSSIISRGSGGNGGDGGVGGQGQSGGSGGGGGNGAGSTASAGRGGDGAHGGHGGGGAGGAGGTSYGIYSAGTSTVTQTSVTFGGPVSGGSGGNAGLSAPSAPDVDGNNGAAGSNGVASNCTTGLGCP